MQERHHDYTSKSLNESAQSPPLLADTDVTGKLWAEQTAAAKFYSELAVGIGCNEVLAQAQVLIKQIQRSHSGMADLIKSRFALESLPQSMEQWSVPAQLSNSKEIFDVAAKNESALMSSLEETMYRSTQPDVKRFIEQEAVPAQRQIQVLLSTVCR